VPVLVIAALLVPLTEPVTDSVPAASSSVKPPAVKLPSAHHIVGGAEQRYAAIGAAGQRAGNQAAPL
jgi:hypothetical protein